MTPTRHSTPEARGRPCRIESGRLRPGRARRLGFPRRRARRPRRRARARTRTAASLTPLEHRGRSRSRPATGTRGALRASGTPVRGGRGRRARVRRAAASDEEADPGAPLHRGSRRRPPPPIDGETAEHDIAGAHDEADDAPTRTCSRRPPSSSRTRRSTTGSGSSSARRATSTSTADPGLDADRRPRLRPPADGGRRRVGALRRCRHSPLRRHPRR